MLASVTKTDPSVKTPSTSKMRVVISFNLFRNDIQDLIDSRQVATKSTGPQIYSYINVKNAFTQGGELELNWQPVRSIKISSGYQYLLTADKDELKRVKAGEVYTKGSNGAIILQRNDYRGLSNRSRNMANLKLTYDNEEMFFTTRVLYRSRWIVATGGSEVNDVNSEFANGFVLVNISAGKEFKNGIRINAGMDNVFNYQDKNNLPNMQGRNIYIGAQFKLVKSK